MLIVNPKNMPDYFSLLLIFFLHFIWL